MSSSTRRGLLAAGASVLLAGCPDPADRLAFVRVHNYTEEEIQVQLSVTRTSSERVVADESLTIEPNGDWKTESLETGEYRVSVEAGDLEGSRTYHLTDDSAAWVEIGPDAIEFLTEAR